MNRKLDKQAMAKEARRNGKSVREIARELGVAVSSVSMWVRGVSLTSEQVWILEQRRKVAQQSGAMANVIKWQAIRKAWRQEGAKLVRKDRTFRDACLLYWAEGAKSQNRMRIVNSDWRMLSLFVGIMKKVFGVTRVSLTILFYENDICTSWEDVIAFWKSKLNVEVDYLTRFVCDNRDSSGKKKNKLPYGVCTVGFYNSVGMIQAIYGGIEVIAGREGVSSVGRASA